MIIIKCPLRISLLGGGTDIPEVYKLINSGKIISTTIDKFIYIFISEHSAFKEKFRLNYSDTEIVSSLNSINNNIIRETLKYFNWNKPIYIGTVADIPANTGLGSSSSFCAGLVKGLSILRGKKLSIEENAKIAFNIEKNKVKNYCGKQDHYIAAYGGLKYFEFCKNEKVKIKNLNRLSPNIKKIISDMLSFYTFRQRESKKILKHQTEKVKDLTNLYISMNRLTENGLKIIKKKNFSSKDFCNIIHGSWELKKTFSPMISSKNIDTLYSKCIDLGAYGGKISGAGGGGFLNIFGPNNKKKEINKLLLKSNFQKYIFKYYNKGITYKFI